MDNNDLLVDLRKGLKRLFGVSVTSLAVIFLTVFFLHRNGLSVSLNPQLLWIMGIILLVLSSTLSIALPIFIRSLFLARTTKRKTFLFSEYKKTQRTLIIIPVTGAFCAIMAYLFLVPKLHLYASVLVALYGIYSAVPARKKLQGELKYFGKLYA